VILEGKMLPIGLSRPLVVLVMLGTSLALVNTVFAQDVSYQLSNPASMPLSGGTPSPLRILIDETLQKNPQIATSSSAWLAAQKVPQEVSVLPDTQVSVQQFSVGSPRPFAGYSNSDFAYIGFGISQDIPYPGKRHLLAVAAQHDSDSMRAQTDSVRANIVGNLKTAYFQLAYIQETLGILQKDQELLKQVQESTEARYRVGQGSQQDVLKAQLQQTKILQEFAQHHQEEGTLEAQIKELLGRPQDSPDIMTEALVARTIPFSAAELLEKARDQNPDLQAQSATLKQREAQIEIAHRNSRPDFNVQYNYQHTASEFRDYYMATFSVRLPNRGRQKAELAQAQEKEEQSRHELDSESQQVLSEVQQQYVKAKTTEEQLKIYSDGLIPQSKATFRAALSAYQSNRQDFASLLSVFLDVLNFDMEYRNQLAEHEAALADLERLTGVEFR
jgi:cobalt-zinc-cadmium efflux system outer membrane protein